MSGQNIEIDKDLIIFPIALDPFPVVLCDKSFARGQCNSSNLADIKLFKSSISGQDPEIVRHEAAVVSMMTNSSNEDKINEKWKDLAKHHFDETQDNCVENLKQFYVHLKSLQNNNEDQRYAKLLQLVPSSNLEHSNSVYDNLFRENQLCNNEDSIECPMSISRYLLKFLRGANHDMEGATKLLLVYLQMMKDHPNYYAGFTHQETMQSIYGQKLTTILRYRDKFGRRVSVTRPGMWNPDKIKFPDLFCAVFQLYEMISQEEKTQIAGCTTIIDAKNFGFKQLRNLAFEDIRVVVNFIQDVFPLWFRQIHIMNAPRAFNMLYNMMRPLFNERVKDSIIFHDKLESLHNFVDKEILPEELGGNSGTFSNSESVSAVCQMSDYFLQLNTYAEHVNN